MNTNVAMAPQPGESWVRLRSACNRAGLKLYWVAAQAGMSYERLRGAVNLMPGFSPLTDDEKQRLAGMISATVEEIWGEADGTAA